MLEKTAQFQTPMVLEMTLLLAMVHKRPVVPHMDISSQIKLEDILTMGLALKRHRLMIFIFQTMEIKIYRLKKAKVLKLDCTMNRNQLIYTSLVLIAPLPT